MVSYRPGYTSQHKQHQWQKTGHKVEKSFKKRHFPVAQLKLMYAQGHAWANKFKGGLKKRRFGIILFVLLIFTGFCSFSMFFAFFHWRCSRAPRRASASKYSIWPWQHQPAGTNNHISSEKFVSSYSQMFSSEAGLTASHQEEKHPKVIDAGLFLLFWTPFIGLRF